MLLKFLDKKQTEKSNMVSTEYFFETPNGVSVVYEQKKVGDKKEYFLDIIMDCSNQLYDVEYFKNAIKYKTKELQSIDDYLAKKIEAVLLSSNEKDFLALNDTLTIKEFVVGNFYELPLSKVLMDNLKKAESFCLETIKNNLFISKENEENYQKAKNELDDVKINTELNKELFNTVVSCPDNELTSQKVIGLINKGARFDYYNDVGDNAFILACRKNMKLVANTIFDELVKMNSEFLFRNVGFDWNHQNSEGETAMFFVVKRNNDELLEKMCVNDNLFVFNIKNKGNKDIFETAKSFNNKRIVNILTDKYEINIVQNKKRLQQGF